jgi:hypothetical protein
LEVNEALRLGFWEGLSLASSAAPPLSTKQISHLRHHLSFNPLRNLNIQENRDPSDRRDLK